jgi:hypothetical protein
VPLIQKQPRLQELHLSLKATTATRHRCARCPSCAIFGPGLHSCAWVHWRAVSAWKSCQHVRSGSEVSGPRTVTAVLELKKPALSSSEVPAQPSLRGRVEPLTLNISHCTDLTSRDCSLLLMRASTCSTCSIASSHCLHADSLLSSTSTRVPPGEPGGTRKAHQLGRLDRPPDSESSMVPLSDAHSSRA